MSLLSSLLNKKNDPDFLVIGAQKSGTTSLFQYLNNHPDVFLPEQKELHFFTSNFEKGLEWYRSALAHSKKQEFTSIGELTPYYLFHPLVPQRVKELYSNIKLIAILRNPVDRAFSHYSMQYSRGLEKRSFEEAIKEEIKTTHKEEQALIDGSITQSDKHQKFSYLSRGLYFNQLNNWLKHFEAQQFLFLSFEEFITDTNQSMHEVYNFLGVDPMDGDYNKNFETKYSQSLNESSKTNLEAFYQPYNLELYKLLNKDFGW